MNAWINGFLNLRNQRNLRLNSFLSRKGAETQRKKEMPAVKTTIVSIGMPKDMLKARNSLGKKIVKPVLQELVRYWHMNILGRHFEHAATSKYNYAKRTASTRVRKLKHAVKGGSPQARINLIWSGDTKKMAMRMIDISGSAKAARGKMTLPFYIRQKQSATSVAAAAGDKYAQRGAEIVEVSQREADKLAKMADTMMTRRINENKEKTTKRV
jgi:hypothetical protein